MSTEADTINFVDAETGKEALAIVRYDKDHVMVSLSHREGGDVEVVMSKDKAQQLLEALRIAAKE